MEWFLNIRVSPSMNVLTIGYLRVTCITAGIVQYYKAYYAKGN